jgi:SulP family sulfate permease
MTMIPESLSFAILAGLSPLTGLYAAFMMGLVTAVLGGPRHGFRRCRSNHCCTDRSDPVSLHRISFCHSSLAGMLQMIVGIFKLGKFVRLIPQPVMYGFLNGLAVIIFMAQIEQFKIIGSNGVVHWLKGSTFILLWGLTALTIGIVYFFQRLQKWFRPP